MFLCLLPLVVLLIFLQHYIILSFTGVLDIVTPLKEIRIKQNTEPWMSTEILNLIKERDELLLK
jgi:hypothetical protein